MHRARLIIVFLAFGGAIACTGSSTSGAGGSESTTSSTGVAPPCGSRGGMRGLSQRSIQVGATTRTYEVYLPDGLDPTVPIPFVFVHHGYLSSSDEIRVITSYVALADTEKFGVVFPDGEGGPDAFAPPWNIGSNVCPAKTGVTPQGDGDDFGFLDAMKADVALDQCLDEAHLFITGFSMGGYFVHHAACMRTDFRGAAPHSGGTHDLSACADGPIPIIIFHGTSDGVIPDGCDDPAATDTPSGVTPSALAWAVHDGCAPTASTKMTVKNGTCELFDGCPKGGQVELCTFDGMGHCWAGGASPDGKPYPCADFESATMLEWNFWKAYAW
jgi:polyhydroxybutyrate depolymerase